MYKEFDSIAGLMAEVVADKEADGAGASTAHRYPVRFVLFDNFADSKRFVEELLGRGVSKMQQIVDWISTEAPDQMLTYSELAERVCQYAYSNDKNDCIVAPFSELARFYDNAEFDALVSRIKGIESAKSQRLYVPLIGQYGKMAKFFDDTQSIIWRCKAVEKAGSYRMVLTQSTYGVKGLERRFSVIPTLTAWLEMWRKEESMEEIICTSPSIFSLAHFAQPDNAFNYTVCNNAYELLTKGLHLDFGDIVYKSQDAAHWETLARSIECEHFSFDDFFNKYFDIYDLDDAEVFAKTWFEHTGRFERWLLATYYTKRFCDRGYICQTLRETTTYSNQDFVSAVALNVFVAESPITLLEERMVVMQAAAKWNVQLSEETEKALRSKLECVAANDGYEVAMRYMTCLTDAEKELMIRWVGEGHIAASKVIAVFPALSHYLEKSIGLSAAGKKWLLDYVDAYKAAKIRNRYTNDVRAFIEKENAHAATFYSWYNMFKTVRTELDGRDDIDVVYWIDGLGIDWLPYIKWVVGEHADENVHVEDIIIAHSLLPSTTERNKDDLLKIVGAGLSKKGDLDSFAHKCTPYPHYIIEEMKIVEQAVTDIIHEHAGKKVAIVSDHGLSYLSQLCDGYNLGGIKSDHCGRLATIQTGGKTQDDKYVVLDDGATICALRHESLAAKIHDGQGCHGGCTPEEVLVPIIILSSQPKSSSYTISLVDNEVSGANPVLTFRIKGITAIDTPSLIYNKEEYNLNTEDGIRYISDRIALQQKVNEVEVHIGNYSQTFKLKINLGAEEDDLFDL